MLRSFVGARSGVLQSGLSLSKYPGPRLLISTLSGAGTQLRPCPGTEEEERRSSLPGRCLSMGQALKRAKKNTPKTESCPPRAPTN